MFEEDQEKVYGVVPPVTVNTTWPSLPPWQLTGTSCLKWDKGLGSVTVVEKEVWQPLSSCIATV